MAYFQHSNVIETGLSEFHKMVVTIMKTTFRSRKLSYRKYKLFPTILSETLF